MQLTEKELLKFFARVQKTSKCWVWTAKKDRYGYGKFWLRGSEHRANRISFFIHHGNFPEGKPFACHTCDNPSCVNPDHLFAGNHLLNARDMASKGRQVFQRNPNKAPRGIENGAYTKPEMVRRGSNHGMSKLNESQVRLIISEQTKPGKQLALEFNVSPQTICSIRTRKTWKHLEIKDHLNNGRVLQGIRAEKKVSVGFRPTSQKTIEV